jgi:CheY-like chemotaxis protein
VIGEATTGHEVVTQAAELQPDVILMDLNMPELNGIEATRRILKAAGPAWPGIYQSCDRPAARAQSQNCAQSRLGNFQQAASCGPG